MDRDSVYLFCQCYRMMNTQGIAFAIHVYTHTQLSIIHALVLCSVLRRVLMILGERSTTKAVYWESHK